MRKRILITLALVFSAYSQLGQANDLAGIYQQATENDPQFKGTEAAYEAARSQLSQSRANFLPSINFVGQKSETTHDIKRSGFKLPLGEQDSTATQYAVSLNLPLFRYSHYAMNDQASARVAQASAQYEANKQALIVRTAKAYFDILAAQDNLEFAQAETKAISRQLEQTKQRFKVGQIAKTGVHEAQARFDLGTAQQIAAENQLAIAQEALYEITGSLPGSLKSLKDETPLLNPEPANIEAWTKTAREQNLGIIAAKAGVEMAYSGVKQARAGHLPNIDLFAKHGDIDTDAPMPDMESTETTVGVQISMNLFQGGGIAAASNSAKWQHRQAKYGLEQQLRATDRLTRSSYMGVTANISRVKALKQALLSTQSAFESVEAGYKAGGRSTVDVLNAQRELFRAKRDYAQARYGYILNTLQLKQAAGILQADDIKQINNWLQ